MIIGDNRHACYPGRYARNIREGIAKKKKKKKGRRRMRREHKIISIAQTDAIGVNGPIIIINIFFFFSFFVQLQLNTFLCNHITDFKLGFFV